MNLSIEKIGYKVNVPGAIGLIATILSILILVTIFSSDTSEANFLTS